VLPMAADRETTIQDELVAQAQRLLLAPWRVAAPDRHGLAHGGTCMR
jgi:hypothetical protein